MRRATLAGLPVLVLGPLKANDGPATWRGCRDAERGRLSLSRTSGQAASLGWGSRQLTGPTTCISRRAEGASSRDAGVHVPRVAGWQLREQSTSSSSAVRSLSDTGMAFSRCFASCQPNPALVRCPSRAQQRTITPSRLRRSHR